MKPTGRPRALLPWFVMGPGDALSPSLSPSPATGKKESLYIIHDSYLEPGFKVLDFNRHPCKWQTLPPAPFMEKDDDHDNYCGIENNWSIRSFTVVDDGHTICLSTNYAATYCFDTRSRKWWQAGNWALPFDDRAEYVPEVDTWIGCSWSDPEHQLCASSDLSAMDADRAPTLQYVWEDLRPPEEQEKIVLNRRFLGAVVSRGRQWELEDHELLILDGGRFCVAMVFTEHQRVRVGIGYDGHDEDQGLFMVLTGVEVLRGGEDSGEAGLGMGLGNQLPARAQLEEEEPGVREQPHEAAQVQHPGGRQAELPDEFRDRGDAAEAVHGVGDAELVAHALAMGLELAATIQRGEDWSLAMSLELATRRLKMIRRFVNLVAENYSSNYTYSLHRLDVAKHLFYPSTAEAQAANANKNNNGSGDPSKVEILQRLPPASMCFEQLPPTGDDWSPDKDVFVLLSPRSSESRILHVSNWGPACIYDTDTHTRTTLPCRDGYLEYNRMFISIAGASSGKENESIYLFNDNHDYPSFEVLDLNEEPPRWRSLPPLPLASDGYIQSFTVVNGGGTICVSSYAPYGYCTHCFDTRRHKWWKSGDWELPFAARADYIPEVDSWIGFSSLRASWPGHKLCASSDLSTAVYTQQEPTLQHIWEDLKPPMEEEEFVMNQRFLGAIVLRSRNWTLENADLLNLGGGRFCVAKVFTERQTVRLSFEGVEKEEGPFLVLTGVEVLRGEAGLRMVKHKRSAAAADLARLHRIPHLRLALIVSKRRRRSANSDCESTNQIVHKSLKMIRQYVNLVAANRCTRTYSLHRLNVAKHLFYPSTAEAEAATTEENSNGSGKSSRIGRLRRLPPASMSFQQFPPPTDNLWPPKDMFMLLSPGSSEGRILHVTEEGPGFIYDADANSTSTIPSRDGPYGYTPTFIPIAGAGTGKEKEVLYLLNPHHRHLSFEVLDFNEQPRKWQPLPPPLFANGSIQSFTVVDGGATICVSTWSEGTHCFDMRSRRWWHAGDWRLPFIGRAEYVPQLGAWLGFSGSRLKVCSWRYDLSASWDLSDMDAQREPALQHIWEDLKQPEEEEEIKLNKRFLAATISRTKSWTTLNAALLNLGGARFCIAKVFHERQAVSLHLEEYVEDGGKFVVLTGVEVLRGGDSGEVGLRMMKHKSKRYMFSDDEIKWVL
ncbi:hypothetical protein EJB05_15284, partial [Eragrostis curvula]